MKGKEKFMKDISEKSIKELVDVRKQMKKDLFTLKAKNAIR
jgi:ribosomal protein L29